MFRLSYSRPCEIQGTLKLKKDPAYYGLGYYEDIDGVEWDVHSVRMKNGQTFVNACPVKQLHPYLTDTSGDIPCNYEQSWLPYRVQVIGATNEI